jgi:hypothetical protein
LNGHERPDVAAQRREEIHDMLSLAVPRPENGRAMVRVVSRIDLRAARDEHLNYRQRSCVRGKVQGTRVVVAFAVW